MQLRNALKIGLGFGLPMVLTGVAFWWSSGWLTQQVFGQSDLAVTQINTTDTQKIKVSFEMRVLAIDADVEVGSQVSKVTVQTGGSALQEMKFEFPSVDYSEIEQAIAQELGISPKTVRSLIRYRVN